MNCRPDYPPTATAANPPPATPQRHAIAVVARVATAPLIFDSASG
jgi:hypothetical protein